MKDDGEDTHLRFYITPSKIPNLFTSDILLDHEREPDPITLEYWLSHIGKDNDNQLRRNPNKKLTIECQWGKYSKSFTILAKVEDTGVQYGTWRKIRKDCFGIPVDFINVVLIRMIKMTRKAQPGHGFWIISDYSYGNRRQVCHCSVCGLANSRPIGEFCRWCGAHMDQEELDLSGAHTSKVYAEVVIKE